MTGKICSRQVLKLPHLYSIKEYGSRGPPVSGSAFHCLSQLLGSREQIMKRCYSSENCLLQYKMFLSYPTLDFYESSSIS